MTAIEELIREVEAAGITIRPDPPDIIVTPADRLTPELEGRLRRHKADILRRLEMEASMRRLESAGPPDTISVRGRGRTAGQSPDSDELSESMRRLGSAGVCIAIFEDGGMRVVVSEVETVQAIAAGGTMYSPADLYYYVRLDPRDRRMLHEFKRRFGARTEWRTGSQNIVLEDN